MTKSGLFWTVYLPRLVNIVCKRPLRTRFFFTHYIQGKNTFLRQEIAGLSTNSLIKTEGDFYGPTSKEVILFHLFFQVLCIYYQPNLKLSSLEHLASFWEVSGLSTRLNFDFFSFKILQIFSHFIFFNFPKIWTNVEFIPVNLIIFKAPPVQIWGSCCTGYTYFSPPSRSFNRL